MKKNDKFEFNDGNKQIIIIYTGTRRIIKGTMFKFFKEDGATKEECIMLTDEEADDLKAII